VRLGHRISDLLRRQEERRHLGTIQLIQCLRLAFGLSIVQASPVGGWLPDGNGEISHAKLDDFIGQAIEAVHGRAEQNAAADRGNRY
jgi:hypothetical protein